MSKKPISCSDNSQNTVVSVKDDKFYINNRLTYEGRRWNGMPIEGLLLNSRMINGIFDDLNPNTRELWAYPDTKEWDPDRNTDEFINAMEEWNQHGLLAFTVNLQGGSPQGYGNQGWLNPGYTEDGGLRPEYMSRLRGILDRADELNMAVILGLFYFGQDQNLRDEQAVCNAVDNVVDWLFDEGYGNVLMEVNNECDVAAYDHEILKPARVHELIVRIKNRQNQGRRFLVGTSYKGGSVPKPNVVKVSDFILLHGNGVGDPNYIVEMVENTRKVEGYRPMPILFNEDDHYDFEKPMNNFVAAVSAYASWGLFDYRRKGEPFEEGYQSVPADWGIHSDRKKGFFSKLKEITG
jgi:hypothetical protein